MDFVETQARAWTTVRDWWKDAESVNGPGSTLALTENLRARLPGLFADYGIRSMLDVPCGDWNWMQHVDLSYLDRYVGWDVEPSIINDNWRRFGRRNVRFVWANALTASAFPCVNLILCKDFLYHLPTEYISQLLVTMKASGSRYLLTTTFPGASNERPCTQGQHGLEGYFARAMDLAAPPFSMDDPVEVIRENDVACPGYDMSDNLSGHTLTLFRLKHHE